LRKNATLALLLELSDGSAAKLKVAADFLQARVMQGA
jgi:hypothetical protein